MTTRSVTAERTGVLRGGEVCRCYGKEEGYGGFGNGKVHVDTGAGKKGAVFAILLFTFFGYYLEFRFSKFQIMILWIKVCVEMLPFSGIFCVL